MNITYYNNKCYVKFYILSNRLVNNLLLYILLSFKSEKPLRYNYILYKYVCSLTITELHILKFHPRIINMYDVIFNVLNNVMISNLHSSGFQTFSHNKLYV